MAWLHHRMPVILSSQAEIDLWLGFDTLPDEYESLMQPKESKDILRVYQVAPLVNSVKNNSAECIQPIEEYRAKNGLGSARGNGYFGFRVDAIT